MNEQQFTQLLGGIDPALIARAEAPVPMRKKPRFKLILIAAVLALLAGTALVIVPLIPTTLGIDYITSPTDGTETAFSERNVWIYYTTENGKQKREYVRLPGDKQNVFDAWKHLSGLGEDVQLVEMDATETTGRQRQIMLTLSTALRDHPDAEVLAASLQRTFAAYYGIPKRNVTLCFADPLQFSHDLTDTPIRVKSGETFTVTVTMTNVSKKDIVFEGSESDFVPKAKLLAKPTIYVSVATAIYPEALDQTTEIAEYRLAPGESKSITYTFRIPYATVTSSVVYFDLTVSFGQHSKTFEKVVSAAYNYSASGARSAFADFTLSHTSEDRTELQSIWGSYTYQGENIMEQIQILSTDQNINGNPIWSEGGHLMQGDQLLFEYSNSAIQLQYGWIKIHSHSFKAAVLPDGMTLPMGITEQDNILDALLKMGVDEQTALEYLTQQGTVPLAGKVLPDLTSSIIRKTQGNIYLLCESDRYVIECIVKKQVIAGDDPYPNATRKVSLVYDRDSQSFLGIRFDITLPTRPSITFDALPTFTLLDGKECTITLTQEQADLLLNAMTNGTWKSSVQDAEYDCKCMIGDIEIGYASESGILQVGSFSVQFRWNDWIDVNKMLGLPVEITLP